MSNQERKIVSVQVAPFAATKLNKITEESFDVEIQAGGADENTVGHAVYVRYHDGKVEHVADRKAEAEAIKIAQGLCVTHGVAIETPAWLVDYGRPIEVQSGLELPAVDPSSIDENGYYKAAVLREGLSYRTGRVYPPIVIQSALNAMANRGVVHGEIELPTEITAGRQMAVNHDKISHLIDTSTFDTVGGVVYVKFKPTGEEKENLLKLLHEGNLTFGMRSQASLHKVAGVEVAEMLYIVTFDVVNRAVDPMRNPEIGSVPHPLDFGNMDPSQLSEIDVLPVTRADGSKDFDIKPKNTEEPETILSPFNATQPKSLAEQKSKQMDYGSQLRELVHRAFLDGVVLNIDTVSNETIRDKAPAGYDTYTTIHPLPFVEDAILTCQNSVLATTVIKRAPIEKISEKEFKREYIGQYIPENKMSAEVNLVDLLADTRERVGQINNELVENLTDQS